MKTSFGCEKCEEEFQSEEDCMKHEQNCSKIESRWCYKCGKTASWEKGDTWSFAEEQSWHHFDIGQAGYGSGFDGCEIAFVLCDQCLSEFISSFVLEGQEKVDNSGSNCYLPTEVWLKEKRGELTDEEYEEWGMCSPRQEKAYKERFPVCNNVKIKAYKDGSRGSNCSRGASGDGEGKCRIDVSDECFGCTVFKQRKGEIEVFYQS